MMDLQSEIIRSLKSKFRFKTIGASWMQEGQCPDCGQWKVYCANKEPKVVKCGKENNCGWSDSVRNLLPDLFEDWSKRFPQV